MAGYITYTEDSVLAPTVTVGDIDTYEQVLTYVVDNYGTYQEYKGYIMQGPYSDYVNQAMAMLFTPRREPITTGKYVTFIDRDTPLPPVGYTIPIVRNIYMLSHVEGNIYQQGDTVGDTTEQYDVGTIDGVPVYIGKQGAFLLSDDPIHP